MSARAVRTSSLPPEPSAGSHELLTRWHRDRDPRTRERLVQEFMPLARKLAGRYARAPEPLEDLVQVATIGLLHALDRFDPSRGAAFTSFAVPTIVGELKRHFRDHCWSIHVPRPEQELSLKVPQAEQQLTAAYHRSPTIAELADYLEVSVEALCTALDVSATSRPASLEAPVRDDEGQRTALGETVGGIDESYGLVDAALSIRACCSALGERDRRLLRLRYDEGLTQREIAARVGCSQMQVSRLLRRVLTRLQELYDDSGANGVTPPIPAPLVTGTAARNVLRVRRGAPGLPPSTRQSARSGRITSQRGPELPREKESRRRARGSRRARRSIQAVQ
jgi:RNA polymerase sigma-B factor